ncbi:site-specific integrase [Brachyspira hyodysenteriae]|uniref:tyrosine-type recombinase/integrase n=1 Tax=Brachyspira hyodysenteriae TaxID=159 RepID=UPI0022CD4CCD|nr:site-specific integrase [Brachyspira hyodysenteriae]MCZ9977241.1 site-specific integrase [Brachyspira hyodysenteriae]MCZ9979542.1 site-specific integrase [Brachyspira hyodysenteriae]MCZ9995567.1 site-specific integrase [Brachyspira hyodysenteriae]MCZ9996013.1 site-specific integrase [Brachyspira hyodysenteriae]MDA0042210.1 site-specific integrase [Brachyspira hyodysenteriae]
MASKSNNKLIAQNNNNIITEKQAELPLTAVSRLIKQANYLNILDYMKEEQLIKQIDYETEKEKFFKQCSKTKSNHTKRQYRNGLNKLEEYCLRRSTCGEMNNKNILFIKAREADDFITEVNSSELSNLSVRALVSSCSSFFSFLERRYPFMKNPFRGTKTRPPVKNKKRLEVPTKKEIELIIKDISDPLIKVAIIFIMECGVRVGALPKLEIRNNKYYSYSKGKEISWKVTEKVIKLLKQNNISFNCPFKNKSSEVIRNIFYRSSKRLYNQGKIKAAYSIHDIRHYFAVTLYKQTKDIELIRQALNHSSIAITGIYLKSLEVE